MGRHLRALASSGTKAEGSVKSAKYYLFLEQYLTSPEEKHRVTQAYRKLERVIPNDWAERTNKLKHLQEYRDR